MRALSGKRQGRRVTPAAISQERRFIHDNIEKRCQQSWQIAQRERQQDRSERCGLRFSPVKAREEKAVTQVHTGEVTATVTPQVSPGAPCLASETWDYRVSDTARSNLSKKLSSSRRRWLSGMRHRRKRPIAGAGSPLMSIARTPWV